MAVEKMQFSMPMAAGYEGFPFTATQAEKEEAEAFTVKARAEQEAAILKAKVKKAKPEEAILKAKAEVEKEEEAFLKAKAEKEAAILKAKAGCGSKTKASDEPSFMVLAGRRGAGVAEPDEVEYSSDEDFDSDEDPEVSYAKICERFERRTREKLAVLPWLTFESDSSILKRQADYKREQELKRQQEEVSVVA